MAVAPRSGMAVFLVDSSKVSRMGSPSLRRTSTLSTTTMELSTSMPMAMINEARETRCKSMCSKSMQISVPKMEKTRPLPIISPLRMPMVKSKTPTTVTTEASKFQIKL